MLTETEIYLRLKLWLQERSWIILGGQPPGGTNDIPIIELKDPEHKMKGSKGSRKIDLVAFKASYFLLTEVKEIFAHSDIKKLNEIVAERKWRIALLKALAERRLFELHGIPCPREALYLATPSKYIKAVSFNYTGRLGPRDFVTFVPSPGGITPQIGADVTRTAEELFMQVTS